MRMDQLVRVPGANKERKRVGRGNASGNGTYAGKGIKGQKARTGGGTRLAFEGGQLPLVKRLPEKRGFTNKWRVEYEVINLGDLAELDPGAEVTPEILREMGVVHKRKPLKILGDGEFNVPLSITAHRFSASAKEKITAAGGRFTELGYDPGPKPSRSGGPNPRPKKVKPVG
ncbi:MAG: 50S ribosomal protein L15 [Dehalococcoidia bacterium]|nr:50S ribosomal protein L15 [Dehalococcoidia bacterium]